MRLKYLCTVILALLICMPVYAAPPSAVPVLMYHSISDIKNNPAVLAPDKFEKQIKFLSENGYTAITLDDLYAFLTDKKYKLPKKPVVITFDDGYRDTYTTALPILKKYGFKSSLFLVTSKIAKKVFSSEEIKTMHIMGMATYSHTHTHPSLKKLSISQQEKEILSAGKIIRGINNKNQDFFAFPYGHYNASTIKLLKKNAYKSAFSSQPGWVKKGDNPYMLKRIYIGNSVSFTSFKERIQKPNYKLY